MNHIFYDTEYNNAYTYKNDTIQRGSPNPLMKNEIIQIGAVKYNLNGILLDTFTITIKPVVYPLMNPLISSKTHLFQEHIDNGISFKSAYEKFISWCGRYYELFTWSENDYIEMKQNCKYHNLDSSPFATYFDVQEIFEYCLDNHDRCSLKNAMITLNIKNDLMLHNAVNDSICTEKVYRKLKHDYPDIYFNQFKRNYNVPKYEGFSDPRMKWEYLSLTCPQCNNLLYPLILWHRYGGRYINFAQCQKCNIYLEFRYQIKAISDINLSYTNTAKVIPKEVLNNYMTKFANLIITPSNRKGQSHE